MKLGQPVQVGFDIANGDDVSCFTVRNGFAWAHIFVRHGMGETGKGDPRGWVHVSVLSDYGSFGYCWSQIGSEPWWEFLADLDFEYAMRKMLGQHFEVPLDIDACREKAKRFVIERRRERSMSREDARELWNAMWWCDDALTFLADLDRQSGGAMYRHEMWDMRWTEPSPQARGFWEEIWPHFIAGIRPTPPEPMPIVLRGVA